MIVWVGQRTWNGAKRAGDAVTDESGAFEIDNLQPGNHELGAANDALGYPPISPPLKVTIGDTGSCTTITYDAGPRAGRLTFVVTDSVSHKPVTDLTVQVTPAGQRRITIPVGDSFRAGITDPSSVPSLIKLHLEVEAPGYASVVIDLPALKPGELHELTAQIRPNNLGCIIGTAIDDRSVPVKVATIYSHFLGQTDAPDQPPVQADATGRFRVSGLRPGVYAIYGKSESDGFSDLWVGWLNQPELPKMLRVTVPPSADCEKVTVNMGPRGAWIKVIAVDANSQELLPNVHIIFMNAEHSRQGGGVYLAEPKDVLVPSHARFTAQVEAEGYSFSEPVMIDPLIPDEHRTLTVPLQRKLTP